MICILFLVFHVFFLFWNVLEKLKRIAQSEPGNIFRTSLTQLAFFTPPAIHSSSFNVAKGHLKVRYGVLKVLRSSPVGQ